MTGTTRLVFFFSAVVALLMTVSVDAAFCNMKSNSTGPMNTNPIDRTGPKFVKRVKNGELYTVGKDGDDQIKLVHVWGKTGYDFGFAAGTLLKDEMTEVINGILNYFKYQVEENINATIHKYRIPEKWAIKLAMHGLEFLLDVQNDECKPFVDPSYYDEMRGIADATGIDYQMIVRVHMVGELTRGSCSFYGLFGSATKDNKTLQLRALDWDMGAGLQNHPLVTIYHPEEGSGLGHSFANVGWAGWIGVLTGMSSKRIGISEIGVSYPDNTFGTESYVGIPFIFLERQIVQRAKSIWDGLDMITNANRTCYLILGIADGKAKTAREIQYSHSVANIMNYSNLMPDEWWHRRIKDAVYNAMDWICPYYQHIMHNQLTELHGKMTPELSIMNVTSVVQTGDLHLAVYDLTDDQLFVANAKGKYDAHGPKQAYARQFIHFNMSRLWNMTYNASSTAE